MRNYGSIQLQGLIYFDRILTMVYIIRHENELSCQNLKMMKKPEKVREIVQKR